MTKTYAQLAREIAALQALAQKQRAIEAQGAIAKINDMISMYGLTAGDLKFGSTSAAGSRSASKATKGQRGAAASGAKFSDGQGNQWSGRGPRPAWLRDAIAAGQTLESFAAGAAAPATAAPVSSASAENVSSRSVASKQVQARAGSRKGKPRKVSAAVKTPSSPAAAAPADPATSAVKASRKKATPKSRAGKAAVGLEPKQEVKPPVKKSPAKKAVAAKKVPASSAAKKAARAKSKMATSKRPVAAKKTAAPKVAANRNKVGSKPAANSVPVVESQAVSAPEATAATVAA